jgi:hypothetical protein
MSRLKFPLTDKIGEVPLDQDKFTSWGNAPGYYPRETVSSSNFQTEKMMKGTYSKEDAVDGRMLSTQMFMKNKSQVEFKGKMGGSTRNLSYSTSTFGKTIVSQNYVDHKHFLQLMKEKGATENFRRSFEKYIKLNPTSTLKDTGDTLISLFDVDLVVKDCLGDETPEFILDKFKELGNSFAVHGELAWKDFLTVVFKVQNAIEAECAYHKELPPLVMLMTKPKAVDPKLGALGGSTTTYRDNFNGNGNFAFSSTRQDDLFFEKPHEEIGSGLNNAAKILCAGTSKGTHHLPGYRGHIPVNIRNNRKADHGSGKDPHPVVNDLILTQRGMGCVLGYTGK